MQQHLILMHEKKVSILISEYSLLVYETGNMRSWSSGSISGKEIMKKVGGSGLVEIDQKDMAVKLTELGERFASWLVSKGKKNPYYGSPLGGWGERKPPTGVPLPMSQQAGFPQSPLGVDSSPKSGDGSKTGSA
jgi:hypothetical protein